jgi:hypothetical protein
VTARRGTMLLLALVVAVRVSRVRASESPPVLRLVYVLGTGTAADCPPASAFDDQVASRLGRSPFSEASFNLLVVVLEREGGGFRGRMFLRPISGETDAERTLRLRACDDVVRALAVVAGVLLSPPPGPEPPLVVVAEEPSRPRRTQPEAQVSIERPPAAPLPRWQLSAGVAVEAGGAPRDSQIALGGTVAAALLTPVSALGLELRALAPRTVTVGRGQLTTLSAGLGFLPCRRLHRLSACAALTGELLSARARGFDINRSLWRGDLAVGGRVAYDLGSGPLRLRPFLRVEAPLTRWRFTVDGTEVVQRGPLTLGAGLELVGDRP